METYWKTSFCRQALIGYVCNKAGSGGMARKPPPKRDTLRHGNLPEALVNAALKRLEADGVESISLRELARDAGVNHRAVYRHFPDKLSLSARVAEEGWRRMAHQMEEQVIGE